MKSLIEQIKTFMADDSAVAVVWLYGSQADGSATEHSDYDLAVAYYSKETSALRGRLRPEEQALNLAQVLSISEDKISIVDINIAPITLAWEIVSKGIVLVEKDPMRLISEEQRIYSRFEIDVHYHRKQDNGQG